ncbi:unnamed protein product [Trifolium pratense]|uniref:Uncharacterized protein n=1 Tax=Trifolium pratense TaxID=57577 RepID=A0ACB0KHU4_TRIPR|nr:unnamed protein product [Trifolium pratense]
MIRLTRVDKEPEYEMGGCVVCSPNWLLKQELSEIVKSISRLEVLYEKLLMMMTGNLHNAKTFVVALTIWALQRICLDHALQDSVQGCLLAMSVLETGSTLMKPSRDAPETTWQHHLYGEINMWLRRRFLPMVVVLPAQGGRAASIESGTKLYISNLDHGVSNDDIKVRINQRFNENINMRHAASDVSGLAVKCLAPLVRKMNEPCTFQMTMEVTQIQLNAQAVDGAVRKQAEDNLKQFQKLPFSVLSSVTCFRELVCTVLDDLSKELQYMTRTKMLICSIMISDNNLIFMLLFRIHVTKY